MGLARDNVMRISDGTNLIYTEEFVEVGDVVPDKDGALYIVDEVVNDMTSRVVTKARELVCAPNIDY